MTTLRSAMEEASTRLAEFYASHQEINEGGCFEWATEVISMVDCKLWRGLTEVVITAS